MARSLAAERLIVNRPERQVTGHFARTLVEALCVDPDVNAFRFDSEDLGYAKGPVVVPVDADQERGHGAKECSWQASATAGWDASPMRMLDADGWHLESGVARHAEALDTSEIPDELIRSRLARSATPS